MPIDFREFGVVPEDLARKLAGGLLSPDQRFVAAHAEILVRDRYFTSNETAYLIAVAAESILKAGLR